MKLKLDPDPSKNYWRTLLVVHKIAKDIVYVEIPAYPSDEGPQPIIFKRDKFPECIQENEYLFGYCNIGANYLELDVKDVTCTGDFRTEDKYEIVERKVKRKAIDMIYKASK